MKAEHPNNNPLHALDHRVWNYCIQNAVPSIALDIGANEGGCTQQMLEAGLKHVSCFEPVPDVFERLSNRFKDDPRVFCNNVGISDYEGTLENVTVLSAWTLGKPDQYGLSVCPGYVGAKPFNVQLRTIDDYTGSSPVGVIKLDVDGYEHKALAGAVKTLSAYKPPILCELSEYIERVSGSAMKFISFLNHIEYDLVPMDGSGVFRDWAYIKHYYPWKGSFDVMLLPREKTQKILASL